MKPLISNPSKRVTPRFQTISSVREKIGYVFNNNCFPTFLGRLIYVQDEKCYFEVIKNKENPKYNYCAGDIEYLPEHMVLTMKFIEE